MEIGEKPEQKQIEWEFRLIVKMGFKREVNPFISWWAKNEDQFYQSIA